MQINSDVILYWTDYQQLSEHIKTVEEKSAVKAKFQNWVNAAQDFLGSLPSSGKMGDLSSEIKSRVEDWALIPSCSYTPATRQLQVRLVFATANVVDSAYSYSDDLDLVRHIVLQFRPAYDIITKYLKVGEAAVMYIRPMELRAPVTALEQNFASVFLKHYTWNEEKQKHVRIGMPYAMSVYLTYENFSF